MHAGCWDVLGVIGALHRGSAVNSRDVTGMLAARTPALIWGGNQWLGGSWQRSTGFQQLGAQTAGIWGLGSCRDPSEPLPSTAEAPPSSEVGSLGLRV